MVPPELGDRRDSSRGWAVSGASRYAWLALRQTSPVRRTLVAPTVSVSGGRTRRRAPGWFGMGVLLSTSQFAEVGLLVPDGGGPAEGPASAEAYREQAPRLSVGVTLHAGQAVGRASHRSVNSDMMPDPSEGSDRSMRQIRRQVPATQRRKPRSVDHRPTDEAGTHSPLLMS